MPLQSLVWRTSVPALLYESVLEISSLCNGIGQKIIGHLTNQVRAWCPNTRPLNPSVCPLLVYWGYLMYLIH